MAWVVIQRQTVCVIISVYGPQAGRTRAEKQECRDALERMLGMVELDVMLCIAGDFNVHVGIAEQGEEARFGKYICGTRNREGQELVELVGSNGMAIAGSFLQKQESHKITSRSGQHRT